MAAARCVPDRRSLLTRRLSLLKPAATMRSATPLSATRPAAPMDRAPTRGVRLALKKCSRGKGTRVEVISLMSTLSGPAKRIEAVRFESCAVSRGERGKGGVEGGDERNLPLSRCWTASLSDNA
jgi:hypothetical protein